jgi:hypothetical protein
MDMDGTVLLDLFETSFADERDIRRHGVSVQSSRGVGQPIPNTDDGVKQRLRALGYID